MSTNQFDQPKVLRLVNDDKHNCDIFQSYVWTVMRNALTVYEKRIMYNVILLANQHNPEFHTFPFKSKILNFNMFGDAIVQIPIKAAYADEQDTNYAAVKKALKSLATKGAQYEDEDVWQYTQLITEPRILKGQGIMQFRVPESVWYALCNMTQGFRRFEFLAAMRLRSERSMHFYELMSGCQNPLYISIQDLKARFGIPPEQYPLASNFLQRVIQPCKRELDAKSPYTFDYKLDIGKHRKIKGITLTPIYQPALRDPALAKKDIYAKLAISGDIYTRILQRLTDIDGFHFNNTEIKRHRDLFVMAQDNISDFGSWIDSKFHEAMALDIKNPKGWLIGAIRGTLRDMGYNVPVNKHATKTNTNNAETTAANNTADVPNAQIAPPTTPKINKSQKEELQAELAKLAANVGCKF